MSSAEAVSFVDQPDGVHGLDARALFDLPAAGLGVADGYAFVELLHHVEQRLTDGLGDAVLLVLQASSHRLVSPGTSSAPYIYCDDRTACPR